MKDEKRQNRAARGDSIVAEMVRRDQRRAEQNVVKPPTPVCETVPAVVTSPNAIASRSSSASRLPPAIFAVFAFGSTRACRYVE